MRVGVTRGEVATMWPILARSVTEHEVGDPPMDALFFESRIWEWKCFAST
jgi:hypothetical protein